MSSFRIRPATVADAERIARHRAAMFRDMRHLADADVAPLVEATIRWLRDAMPSGSYVGWMAVPTDAPAVVIAGAGMQLRPLIPRPAPAGGILDGRQGLIVNVFVEPAWRRRGVARALTEAAVAWARESGIASIVLHASEAGRPLYTRLGFVPTNEMRYDEPR